MNTRLKCVDCGESWHPHADVYKRIDDHTCLCAGCGFVRLEKAEATLERVREWWLDDDWPWSNVKNLAGRERVKIDQMDAILRQAK